MKLKQVVLRWTRQYGSVSTRTRTVSLFLLDVSSCCKHCYQFGRVHDFIRIPEIQSSWSENDLDIELRVIKVELI